MKTYAFVDGGYLRAWGGKFNVPYPNPWTACWSSLLIAQGVPQAGSAHELHRLTYYDALPDELGTPESKGVEAYMRSIEVLQNCQLGYGTLRKRRGRGNEQKGVDTLVAVDMLVGAFTGLFEAALLLSGDADFVPVVHEVKRRGVHVIVGAHEASLSDELRRSADRVRYLGPDCLRALAVAETS